MRLFWRALIGLLLLAEGLAVVLVGNTLHQDSRQVAVAPEQLFSPQPALWPEDLGRLHGTDERIAVAQLADMVRFYHRLITQSATNASTFKGPAP